MLVVAVDRPTGIVRLQVETKNRQLSALVARRLLDLVNDFNLRRRQTQAAPNASSTPAAARRRSILHLAEAALADFRATNIDFLARPVSARAKPSCARVSLAQQSTTIDSATAREHRGGSQHAGRHRARRPGGLVEAQPRHTAAILLGAFALGLIVACILALVLERRARA
jgi:hypothetical protein